jgi:esterase/lipase superfamily enzyme
VSIPREHRLGEIERPTLRKLQFREDPEKHLVLMNISLLDKDPFFSTLARRIQASPGKSSFVFVHGYNVSFADAARRTAQMHYDLGFDGAPIFYSWPSQASTAKYTVDEANIEWAQSNLRAFLQELLAKSASESVYLVAHSMGNRALTTALAALAEQPGAAGKIREVILAAPDIDADVFRRDIAPSLKKLGAGVTLYASSADRALIASRTVHGSPRAGDSGILRVVTPGVETIDASGIDTSWLGHSYFAEAQSLIADMLNLVRNHQRAEGRTGLIKEVDAAGNYWRIKK